MPVVSPTVDPYKLLGVSSVAAQGDIKKAYRALAKQLHPDKNKSPGAEEKFKELSAAYELIKDADARREYDHLKAAEKERSAGFKYSTSGGFNSSTRNTGQPGSSTFRSQSFNTRRPGASTSGFRTSFRPTAGGTGFTFASYFDDDFTEAFSTFFRSPPPSSGDAAGSRFSQPHARRQFTSSDFMPGSAAASTGGIPRGPSFFDKFLSDQLSDVNRLFNQLFEGIRADTPFGLYENNNNSTNGIASEASQLNNAGDLSRRTNRRNKETTPFDDMYDWSVPMFDHSARNWNKTPSEEPEQDDAREDDMTRIRFPCIYCGRKLTCQDLNKHEEVCKRFYTAASAHRNSTAADRQTGNKGADEKTTNGKKATAADSWKSKDESRGRSAAAARMNSNNSNSAGKTGPYESFTAASAAAAGVFDSPRSTASGGSFESARSAAGAYDSPGAAAAGQHESPRSAASAGGSFESPRAAAAAAAAGAYNSSRPTADRMDRNSASRSDDTTDINDEKWTAEEFLSARRKNSAYDRKSDSVSCPWCRRVFNQIAFENHLLVCNTRRNNLNNPTGTTSSRYSSTYTGKQQPQSRTVPPAGVSNAQEYRRGSAVDPSSYSSSGSYNTSKLYRREPGLSAAYKAPGAGSRPLYTGGVRGERVGRSAVPGGGGVPRSSFTSTERLRRYNAISNLINGPFPEAG